MIPSDLTRDDRVFFIPYTTDKPQIREGQIEKDSKGKFIKYSGGLCDDGEWYICRIQDVRDMRIIHRLNRVLREVEINEKR